MGRVVHIQLCQRQRKRTGFRQGRWLQLAVCCWTLCKGQSRLSAERGGSDVRFAAETRSWRYIRPYRCFLGWCWGLSGFDSLVVDEAHNYKNGLVVLKMSRVSGVQTTPAQKSEDILMKTQFLNENYGEKNIIFATGTPVETWYIRSEMPILRCFWEPLKTGLKRENG